MTVFQSEVLDKLTEAIHCQSGTINHNTYECRPNEFIGHKKGDVYIEATVRKNDLQMTVYIYTDEASAKVTDHTFMFELPDYRKDSYLLGNVLISFITNYLEGELPKQALMQARIKNGLPS